MALKLVVSLAVEPYQKKYYRNSQRYSEMGQYLRFVYLTFFRVIDELAMEQDLTAWKRLHNRYFSNKGKPVKRARRTRTINIYYPEPPQGRTTTDGYEVVNLTPEMEDSFCAMLRANFVNDLTTFCLSNYLLGNKKMLVEVFKNMYNITEEELQLEAAYKMVRKTAAKHDFTPLIAHQNPPK